MTSLLQIPAIIAHRGLRSEFPENTIPAIEAALRLHKLTGVEFDVEIARDLVAVVTHQETLIPDSLNKSLIYADRNYCSRDWVIQHTAKEIQAMDAGVTMDPRFRGTPVPLLSEVLALPWQNKHVYVELKDATYWGNRDPQRINLVIQAVLSDLEGFQGTLHIVSFNPSLLLRLKQHLAAVSVLALWVEWRGRVKEAIALAKAHQVCAISLPEFMILDEPQWIAQAHDNGVHIHAYPLSPTRGEPEMQNWTAVAQYHNWEMLAAYGIDGLLSDFAREAIEFFYGS